MIGFFRAFWQSFQDPKLRLAWAVAIAADAVQIIFLPLFAAGAAFPGTDVVDILVALVLTSLLGWHWAFLPSFIAELIPGLDLLPTWSAALLFVSRQHFRSREPEILPPQPIPPHRG